MALGEIYENGESMLTKIIIKNFKSNIKNYILFFISNIVSVAELFLFCGLNNIIMRAITEPTIMMGIKNDFMMAVKLVTVISILLMVFSMRYYIKLRAKDYGTFMMLGMKKRVSYCLLFGEYTLGCLGSLITGILIGNVFLYILLYGLNQLYPETFVITSVDWNVYRNTIGLCLVVMLGIAVILLIWMDGKNLSTLMMKEEIKEKRPMSSKWLLLAMVGAGFIVLAVRQYNPGTWGYYFSHAYFISGGCFILAFGGGCVIEWLKKSRYYPQYILKINQFDSKYQSNMLAILMLFVIHFFALSYLGTQISDLLPLDREEKNYPYDVIWMAQNKDSKFSEKVAEKYKGTVCHIPMIRATMFYSQEEIGISESTYKNLTGKSYNLKGKEIVVGIENQDFQKEEKIKDKTSYDLYSWLYIGKFNPDIKAFRFSSILQDPKYRYDIKEIHTQSLFGKFTLEEEEESGENTVIFSDEYFEKEWEQQSKDNEEVSVLEVFKFPKDTEQAAWKEIKSYIEKNGVEVFQPDIVYPPHAICYDKTVFLKEQRLNILFLLSSKIFILLSLLLSGSFIMMIKNLSEISLYVRRYEFLNTMGMKKKEQKQNLRFEVQSVSNIALFVSISMAIVYVLMYVHWNILNGKIIKLTFWKYWGCMAGFYVVVQIFIQHLFAMYIYRRVVGKEITIG